MRMCQALRHNEVAKVMDYMLKRIDEFTHFLDDGRICLSNNAASGRCGERLWDVIMRSP